MSTFRFAQLGSQPRGQSELNTECLMHSTLIVVIKVAKDEQEQFLEGLLDVLSA